MEKRTLFITRNFPPLVGGMERLIYNAYRQLQSTNLCDLVGPQGSDQAVASESHAFGCRVHPLPLFLIMVTVNSLRAALTQRYALIISGSGLTSPTALLIGKLFNIPTVTFIHGLDLVVKNWLYQRFFIPAIRRRDKIIVNSHNTAQLAEMAGVPPDRIEIIFPGVEVLEASAITDQKESSLPDSIKQQFVLLSVGRLIPRKGLAEFIHNALPEIVRQKPDTLLLSLVRKRIMR